jgi:hypothetical protein
MEHSNDYILPVVKSVCYIILAKSSQTGPDIGARFVAFGLSKPAYGPHLLQPVGKSLTAFCEATALPSAVRGPVDFSAFSRFALI